MVTKTNFVLFSVKYLNFPELFVTSFYKEHQHRNRKVEQDTPSVFFILYLIASSLEDKMKLNKNVQEAVNSCP